MLIEEGADKYATNKHGLNCLHIASQGDQPVSLYYFHKMLMLNINEKDHRGSTPLHWAIFSCSELAMVYILAWLSVEELSTRDDEGYTAMHLAIKTSDKLENSRPVRALIYHGAPTNVKDANQNTALDIAKTLENQKIKEEIMKYLTHKTSLVEFL
jgi:ankyrin repeat protein